MISPPSSPRQIIAPIVALTPVAPRHFLLALRAPEIAALAQAGQFLHVLPRDSALFDPLLRRAFSIMAVRGDEVEVLFRVEGVGTARIASKRVGECLDVIGPLGNPFDLTLFHVKQGKPEQKRTPILVGGGVGVPPLIFLGKSLIGMGMRPLMLIGARKADEVLGVGECEAVGITTRVATDDGSLGQVGQVTELLQAELQNTTGAVIYACGPFPMLRAVAAIAARFEAPCQVSLEENMPCGIGVCNGCVVAMKPRQGGHGKEAGLGFNADYGRYQRICVSGPALWAHHVDWEAR